jgi:hypothetical protein
MLASGWWLIGWATNENSNKRKLPLPGIVIAVIQHAYPAPLEDAVALVALKADQRHQRAQQGQK